MLEWVACVDFEWLGGTAQRRDHNAFAALAIADRGYVLETGRIVASGSAEQLSADEDVRKAYLGF